MFAIALLIGIYSYLIFILGLLGVLTKLSIVTVSILFIFLSVFYFYKHKEDLPKLNLKNKKLRPLLFLFMIMAIINLIGALGPEYSFDALWYHLGLPRIFLHEKAIFPVTQGIFYYSLMPKLGEMLFTPFVAFSVEVLAKTTQWLFGILVSIVIYKIARRNFDSKKSFFAVLIFYGSLVVAWESTVAYVDLIRAFFEVMALWGFLIWLEKRDVKIFAEAAIFLGLAISTKVLALGSLPIFVLLFFVTGKAKLAAFKNSILFASIALMAAMPWFIISFLNSGNPIYPVLSKAYSTTYSIILLNPVNLIKDYLELFVKAADPISPLYLIFLPLLFIYFKKLNNELKIIGIYTVAAIVVWYFIPRTGGGRFILPYLPVISVLCIGLIENLKPEALKKYNYFLIIIVFATTIFYRGIANSRYVPVILGLESKDKFLTEHLNFNFGDFYDIDGFFKKTIGKDDKVLLFGFHNLYYAKFPFIHESYVKKGDSFNYIATQGVDIPDRFKDWDFIYANNTTGVKVYTKGGIKWQY